MKGMKVKTKTKDQKKLLDIPISSLKVLAQMATNNRSSVKAYMEKILIEHANKGY